VAQPANAAASVAATVHFAILPKFMLSPFNLSKLNSPKSRLESIGW